MNVTPQRVLKVKSDRVFFCFAPTKSIMLSLIIYPQKLFTLAAHFCPQVPLLVVAALGDTKLKDKISKQIQNIKYLCKLMLSRL